MNVLVLAEKCGLILDIFGVLVILTGVIFSTIIAAFDFLEKRKTIDSYKTYRQNLGKGILLGLELLVAGDIIRSVTGDPTFTSVGVLAILVLIRTFLGITFDMEIDGRWPWNKKTS
jgi:uncharacterized membrane protein